MINLSFAQVNHSVVVVLGEVEQEILRRETNLPQIFPTFVTDYHRQTVVAED